MKFRYISALIILLVSCLAARSDEYFLIPENYFLHKGDLLNLHLFYAAMFEKQKECKYASARTERFSLYENGKRTDLKPIAKDSVAPVITYKLNNPGMALAEMKHSYEITDIDKNAFIKTLDEEGLTKLSEKTTAYSQQQLRQQTTAYLKALFTIDKTTGNLYSKEVGHELEIILNQNPYQLSYGDDVAATIKFKGKAMANAHIDLFIKNAVGKVYPQKLNSDDKGAFFVKLSREGIYLLRLINVEASKSKDHDFDRYEASYSFAFSNTGTLPNTYKQFGFGDQH